MAPLGHEITTRLSLAHCLRLISVFANNTARACSGLFACWNNLVVMLVCTLRQLPDGGIAQLVERLVRNQQVRGSNPLASKAKSVEATSTIRAHFGCTSGSVIPLPPQISR